MKRGEKWNQSLAQSSRKVMENEIVHLFKLSRSKSEILPT